MKRQAVRKVVHLFVVDIHVLTDRLYFLFALYSSLAVGSKSGYKLFSLNSVEKLEEIYEYGKLRVIGV